MKYICSWSGGKDSTASIILAHEKHEPLDTIIFSEVMFDKKNDISGENPKHMDFVINKAKPIFESWGYEVKILHADRDYLDVFHRVMEVPRKHMEHKGMKYGFPISGLCSVKRDCKMKPITDFYKSINGEYTDYVGVAVDEPKRLESMHKSSFKVSLLEKYKFTGQMAKELCKKYKLLSPSYELTKRNGCWFCPNAKLCEHNEIRNTYPKVWRNFISLEKEKNVAQPKWNTYGETLAERELKLTKVSEYYQMSIFDYV